MATMTPAPAMIYEKGKLYQIPITDLKPDPNQPRKVIDPDALVELIASITKFGIIQPLLFRVEDGGAPYLYIVAGERRFQAAQQVGLTVLPAICIGGDYAEIALVENLQRQDLTAVEEAEAPPAPYERTKLHPGAVGRHHWQGQEHDQRDTDAEPPSPGHT